MNKDIFFSLIQSPEQVAVADKSALTDLVRDYPFFHTAHLLLLYNLKRSNSEQYDQQLRESAVHVPDRQVLFNFLYNFNVRSKTESKPLAQEPVVEPASIIDKTNELLEIDDNLPLQYADNESAKVIEFSVSSQRSGDIPYQTQDFELDEEISLSDDDSGINVQSSAFDLIDKFIEENPVFTANRLDLSDSREDISLSSVEDNEEMVTETLATVYISQKLYDKAISIYEKLILKFPEKSTYFASRIEELRNNVK